MFSDILLCADGSEPSLKAAYVAVVLARQFESHVTLVSVFDPSAITAPYIGLPDASLLMATDSG